MRNLLRLCTLACLFALTMVSLCGCHKAKAWQPIPNAPSIDPQRDFTLTWDNTKEDANGLPLNPYWGLEKTKQELPPRKQGDHPYPCEPDPYSEHCTENPNLVKDGPQFPNSVICKLGNLGADFNGHADWAVVGQHGCVQWEDESTDGDYNFFLYPPNPMRSVLTKNNDESIGLEFDSGETIANAQSPFWQKLRAEVDLENADQRSHQKEIAAILNQLHPDRNPRAALIGLVGLDCEHGCKSEIHPVLGLAIETNPDSNDDTWELLVRNWGDEGFCSHYRHLVDFPNSQISILLFDDPSSQGLELIPSATHMFVSEGVKVDFPAVSYWAGRGPVITFTMPPPEKEALIELEIHFKWNALNVPACERPVQVLAVENRAQSRPSVAEDYLAKLRREAPGGPPHAEAIAARPVRHMVAVPVPPTVVVGSFAPPTATSPVKRVALPTNKAQALRTVTEIQRLCLAYKNQLPPYQGKDISAQLCSQKELEKALKQNQK